MRSGLNFQDDKGLMNLKRIIKGDSFFGLVRRV